MLTRAVGSQVGHVNLELGAGNSGHTTTCWVSLHCCNVQRHSTVVAYVHSGLPCMPNDVQYSTMLWDRLSSTGVILKLAAAHDAG